MGTRLNDLAVTARSKARAAVEQDDVYVSPVQPDGSQWMVRQWPDGTVHVSWRADRSHIWGPSVECLKEES